MSSPYYSEYDFPTHKQGDTFLGVIFSMTDGNGDPIELDGALIELKTSTPDEKTLSTGAAGGITILDDSSEDEGRFMIDEQIIDWCPGSYSYEIIFTLPTKKRTYIVGHWVITK
jgi:hypothetical protein